MKYLSVFLGFILEPLLYLPLRGFTFFPFLCRWYGKKDILLTGYDMRYLAQNRSRQLPFASRKQVIKSTGSMKRVFLSFRAEDKDHVQGVRLLALSPIYRDLEFYDESVQAPFNSFSVDYIKQQIRQK